MQNFLQNKNSKMSSNGLQTHVIQPLKNLNIKMLQPLRSISQIAVYKIQNKARLDLSVDYAKHARLNNCNLTHSNISVKPTLQNTCHTTSSTLKYAKNYDTLHKISFLLFGYILCGMIYTAHANTPTNNKIQIQHNDTTQAQKVQVRGDTLVIQDASCQSKNITLLQSLQTKDSKNTTTPQECDDSTHK